MESVFWMGFDVEATAGELSIGQEEVKGGRE